jgi:SET domain-containing protein
MYVRCRKGDVAMERKVQITVVAAVLVVFSIFFQPADNIVRGEDKAPVCVQKPEDKPSQADRIENPEDYISGELDKLGLDTGDIDSLGDDKYLVDVKRFENKSDALRTTGKFRPCTLKVKMVNGKVRLERCGLEDAGLEFDKNRFPSSLEIEEGNIWGRPQ